MEPSWQAPAEPLGKPLPCAQRVLGRIQVPMNSAGDEKEFETELAGSRRVMAWGQSRRLEANQFPPHSFEAKPSLLAPILMAFSQG